ncbi:MAG: GNAT family N-acetyltransferase [Ornithinibacter sp.]
MTDVGPGGRLVVERVTAASWRTWRDVRLASLIDSPRAFWVQYAEAAERTDHEWRERAATTGPTWLAFYDGRPVGTVGLWHAPEQPAAEVYLVGMWVASVARGSDVATRLVGAALTSAAASGFRRVVLDVAHENARARAFYARMGFRPTGAVDRMPWDPSVTEETLALDLPVGS